MTQAPTFVSDFGALLRNQEPERYIRQEDLHSRLTCSICAWIANTNRREINGHTHVSIEVNSRWRFTILQIILISFPRLFSFKLGMRKFKSNEQLFSEVTFASYNSMQAPEFTPTPLRNPRDNPAKFLNGFQTNLAIRPASAVLLN